MLTRVRRLEETRAPVLSPFVRAFGTFAAFAAWADGEVAAGVLDARDFPQVVQCLARWERDGTWGRPSGPAGVWAPGQ